MASNYFLSGSYNVICDRCGFKYKAGELKKEWTGLMVCHKCWEPRHPQDFVRGVGDTQAPPWNRPETTDVFLNLGFVLLIADGSYLLQEDNSFIIIG